AGPGLLGPLAIQRLAELAPRLVLGTRPVAGAHLVPGASPARGTRLALRAFRPRRRVSHSGLLPPAATPSLAHPAAPGRRPARCAAAAGPGSGRDERQARPGRLGAARGMQWRPPPDLAGARAAGLPVAGP